MDSQQDSLALLGTDLVYVLVFGKSFRPNPLMSDVAGDWEGDIDAVREKSL